MVMVMVMEMNSLIDNIDNDCIILIMIELKVGCGLNDENADEKIKVE
jgi:hypothetical protein